MSTFAQQTSTFTTSKILYLIQRVPSAPFPISPRLMTRDGCSHALFATQGRVRQSTFMSINFYANRPLTAVRPTFPGYGHCTRVMFVTPCPDVARYAHDLITNLANKHGISVAPLNTRVYWMCYLV